MIIVYIILLFIAVLLFMLLLGFIDIVYNLITGKRSNLAEKFCEAMNVIVGVICAAVCGIGIPVLILCLLFVIGMLIIPKLNYDYFIVCIDYICNGVSNGDNQIMPGRKPKYLQCE